MTFGERIQQLRKQRKMSQEELGEKLEVTRQTISKWELDQSTPDLDYIIGISNFFEVTTDYLIKGSGEETVTNRGQSTVMPVPQLQYCEDTSQYDNTEYRVSPSGAVSVASEPYIIKVNFNINLKALLKYLLALVFMFLGCMGAFMGIYIIMHPYEFSLNGFFFILSMLLFLISGGVFVIALSVFAPALMSVREHILKKKQMVKNFGDAFASAYKNVTTERTAGETGDSADTYNKDKTENISQSVPNQKVNGANSAFKKFLGVILILLSLIGTFISIAEITYYYDMRYRNPYGVIMEAIFLLISVSLFIIGIKVGRFSRTKVKSNSFSFGETVTDILPNEPLSAGAKNQEKAVKIREKAELKAAMTIEKYKSKAEKARPHNEAAAEKIIAQGEMKAAKILDKAEAKLKYFDTEGGQVKKGAHLR